MTQPKKSGIGPKTIKWIWAIAFAPFVLLALMLALTALGVFGRMPSFEELENPRSNLATEVYSEDGKVIGTFFVQNRSYVQYADLFPADSTLHIRLDGREVPPIVAALIATEDVRFRSHSGIDIPSLARVAVKTVLMQNTSQGGGSTITQQLAKNLFPRDTARNRGRVARMAKLVTSKFKEWITALKLEYNYTKEEIAAMYLNTVEYGSNAYGIKSAAHTFFNKDPQNLNVQEAAVLVGVVNAPTRYSPVRNPENALARRNLVLSRMEKAGGADPPRRLDRCAAHRAQLQARVAQRGYGDLFPRDAAPGDDGRPSPPQPVLHRVGLRPGGAGVRGEPALRLVPQERQGRRYALQHLPRRAEDLYDGQLDDAEICRTSRAEADAGGDPARGVCDAQYRNTTPSSRDARGGSGGRGHPARHPDPSPLEEEGGGGGEGSWRRSTSPVR